MKQLSDVTTVLKHFLKAWWAHVNRTPPLTEREYQEVQYSKQIVHDYFPEAWIEQDPVTRAWIVRSYVGPLVACISVEKSYVMAWCKAALLANKLPATMRRSATNPTVGADVEPVEASK